MRKPDILVMGTGRSGTSKVAEILHKHFGVCFGHSETMLNDFRGEIVYEDRELKKMLKRVVEGDVKIESWLRKFGNMHKNCQAKLTGAKLLWFHHLTIDDFIKISPSMIIRTKRDFRECVESWVRYRRWGVATDEQSREWAEQYVADSEQMLRILVPQLRALGINVLELEFNPERRRVPDEEIIDAIGTQIVLCDTGLRQSNG